MPDGNRRYARRKNFSLKESYKNGVRSLQLFSDLFLVDPNWKQLTMHFMSKYTHERADGNLNTIYAALTQEFIRLYDKGYFNDNSIKFKWVDHSNKILPDLIEIC